MKTREVLEKQRQEHARLFMEKVAELLVAAQQQAKQGGSKDANRSPKSR